MVKKSEPVITVGDLVDTGEVADLLGIAPESVTRYRARGGFPEPLRHFGGSPVWTRAQIAAFIESRPGRGAGGGRPRKQPKHEVAVESREGKRGPYPAPSYRWACSCGDAGRWTRQRDTADEGARRHGEPAVA